MKIVVVVPTYNEEGNIDRCIFALLKQFEVCPKNVEYKILVTDANSSDGTAQKVKELQLKNPQSIFLIEEGKKQGLGKAYIDAFTYAFEQLGADAVMTYDADLSHDESKIHLFVEQFLAGKKYVIGTRYKKGGGIPAEWGPHRKFLSSFGNLFVRILYINSNITDFTSGYKLISKEVFESFKSKISTHKGYTFAISTNLEAIRAGYKPVEIAYKFKERTQGKSKMSSEYIFNGLKFVLQKRFEDILKIRFAKVFIAGGVGAFFQLLTYGIIFYPLIEMYNIFSLSRYSQIFGLDYSPRFLISQMFSIEMGVISTFLVNNSWSFSDKKLDGFPLLRGFIKTHAVTMGAIILQLLVGQVMSVLFGDGVLRHYVYQIIGILVGLIWNFYFYKKIIWKVHK